MTIEWIFIYLALGCGVGFMAGLLGIGGGGILVPLLISIFSYQGMAQEQRVHLALGTSLACMIITSTASARAHALKGTIHWRLALGLAPGIILGAFLMAYFSIAINPVFIALFFAVFMALIAGQLLLNWQPKSNTRPINSRQLLLMGGAIGALSALATVGGGFLTLSYLNYKNIAIKNAIGTAAAIGFPIALAGTLGYLISGQGYGPSAPYIIGFVHAPAFVIIGLSSIIAAPYGVRCASYLAPVYLKRIFAAVSLLLGAKMLYSVL
jgi:uncharacterized protein